MRYNCRIDDKTLIILLLALLCNSTNSLLAMGKFELLHPDLSVDPLGILHSASKLIHQLPLVNYLSWWKLPLMPDVCVCTV